MRLCAFCSLTKRSISSRISFDKSILSSSSEYVSDFRRIAGYSPSLLTMSFMTLCMRTSGILCVSRYGVIKGEQSSPISLKMPMAVL